MARKWQVAAWLGLWCFWVILSRNNHPNLLLNGIATGLLLLTFACAVYINWGVLVPRYWDGRRWFAYWASLLLLMLTLTAFVVEAIMKVYDLLWGPDPHRFGFRVNYGLDFIGMSVHLILATGVVWLVQRKQHRAKRQQHGANT